MKSNVNLQSAYNTFMATKGNKFNADKAKFYLTRIHEESSFSYQKIIAEAIISLVEQSITYEDIRQEWISKTSI